MRIYTRSGDKGETSLYSGERVFKNCLRVEVYGTVDELNATMGLARALCFDSEVRECVFEVQEMLNQAMAQLSSLDDWIMITDMHVQKLEEMIDSFTERVVIKNEFDVPGSNPSSAALHLARTVARRAERKLWQLASEEKTDDAVLQMINRISDLCFILALFETTSEE
jgi:cob(I)alamin adenosyltransferase